MDRLKLKEIIRVRFNKSEETNFDEVWMSRAYRAIVRALKSDECLCFISPHMNQLIFVHGYVEMRSRKTKRRWVVLASRRFRVKRRPGLQNHFEPLMLANYARAVGIELIGLKLFEEYYEYLKPH